VLSAIAITVLLAIAIVVIAPDIDLEDGVFGVEQILYALLMALASIVALRVLGILYRMVVSAAPSIFLELSHPAPPSVGCCLLC
jgi:hypothetical protein